MALLTSSILNVRAGHSEGFCRFGDVGYLMPMSYKDNADAIRALPLRNDDVWVATFPRCGKYYACQIGPILGLFRAC